VLDKMLLILKGSYLGVCPLTLNLVAMEVVVDIGVLSPTSSLLVVRIHPLYPKYHQMICLESFFFKFLSDDATQKQNKYKV